MDSVVSLEPTGGTISKDQGDVRLSDQRIIQIAYLLGFLKGGQSENREFEERIQLLLKQLPGVIVRAIESFDLGNETGVEFDWNTQQLKGRLPDKAIVAYSYGLICAKMPKAQKDDESTIRRELSGILHINMDSSLYGAIIDKALKCLS